MIEKIEPLPKIPEALRLAALQRKLIPFIGAGVSQLGGCPNWNEFADAALKFFVDKGKLSHAQLDQISSLSSRVKLSVALELEKQLPIEFKKLLEPSSMAKKKIGDEVYANLSKLATTFVTTNYDEWLDQNTPTPFRADESPSQLNPQNTSRYPFYKRNDISVENLDVPNAVFHIHGSIRDRESMVLTTVDYLDRYSSHRIDGRENHENPFLTFLQTLFRLKNVLFIGYGLNELEVLEYIVEKGLERLPENNEEPRHYVLQGFFTHELELARSLESYFHQFGIGLLPFSRDERDWDQLVEVIDYLARKIPPGPPLSLPKRLEMEELLS
ncbi:MAG: SIR2 family protein [Desulfovibrionales bacterium]|nr:SIR2 family protein [Desulfovibrionales bacterium]